MVNTLLHCRAKWGGSVTEIRDTQGIWVLCFFNLGGPAQRDRDQCCSMVLKRAGLRCDSGITHMLAGEQLLALCVEIAGVITSPASSNH
jgi:hypothetical protein